MKHNVLIAVVTIVLVYFFITSIGLSLLADASIFLGNFFGGKKEQENSNFLDTLTVDAPPDATAASQITLTGFAYGYNQLEFFVNDKKVLEKSIKQTENFSETVSNLKEGKNEIYVVARGNGKKEKQSEVFTVTYLHKKPELEVTEPAAGSTVHSEDALVKGKTGSENEARVNGQPVVVDPAGTFEYQIRLKEGDNKIQVLATDAAGNTTQLEITVKYVKE